MTRTRVAGWARFRRSGAWRRMARFALDRRGGTAAVAIVMLVPILFAFVAGVELWQAMSIRRSLHTGVYEAARYLTLYPPQSVLQYDWEAIARRFIKAELKNNPFADQQLVQIEGHNGLWIEVTLEGNRCLDKFKIVAEFPIWAPMQFGSQPLPFNETLKLSEVRESEVICE